MSTDHELPADCRLASDKLTEVDFLLPVCKIAPTMGHTEPWGTGEGQPEMCIT